MRSYLLPVSAALLLTACAGVPTHDSKLSNSLAATTRGDIDEAIKTLDAQIAAGSDKTDLLLNLEKGELLRIGTRYQESLLALEIADQKVKLWEEKAKTAPDQLLSQIGAVFMGDSSRTYEGQDYEKVMLTTRMAMNRINLGDLDTARVDIKRTHEREAVIAEFRARETVKAEEEAKEKGIKSEAKELNGYPIETLKDPEVLKLKNGYQNALSHYLAGFVYEALNEPGLAAPGYRKAIELRPDLPVLEEGLRGLDQRTSFRRQKNVTDVLFIVESGNAPARQSKKIQFPVPTTNGIVVVSFSFPVIYPNKEALELSQVNLGSLSMPTALVTDFNVMARRALQDELPGIQARAAVRAVAKGLVQDQMNKKMGAFGGLLGNIVTAATEGEADDRMWRGLPDRVFLARGFVPPGEYDLRLPGQGDGNRKLVVDGRYMVVPVRVFRNKTYFGEPVKIGMLPPVITPAVEEAKPEAPVKRPVKPAKPATGKVKKA
ncbi:COG3014 family protein [Noviherbaspirillum denitrificans]|uniref:Lipoprotein n=1 Tax=Noviherbaspirillum denitrificans TaxID=1968433 RepID=A0A254T6P7_9BURK|nr:hypothetical protein [Noviherbaspirillum denitrificans]OWW18339.1 hypothetical protein AYR66_02520 [Noviherbaspirillum denitrificans]